MPVTLSERAPRHFVRGKWGWGGGEGGDCFYQSIKVFVMAVFISALLCISEHFVSSVLNQMGKL